MADFGIVILKTFRGQWTIIFMVKEVEKNIYMVKELVKYIYIKINRC